MEKIKLLLYCTKSKPYLTKTILKGGKYKLWDRPSQNDINGKIVAECDFEVEKIKWENIENYSYEERLPLDDILDKSCLTKIELEDYLCGNNGYAIHIKNLHIFDKPRELNEFSTFTNLGESIKRPPQNMCKVIDDLDHNCESYILISIRPEWLCKILNGEKTIEVRKKVLKEMIS